MNLYTPFLISFLATSLSQACDSNSFAEQGFSINFQQQEQKKVQGVDVQWPQYIRISANYQVDLASLPGEIIVVDRITRSDIGKIDKTRQFENRVSVNDAYFLTPLHKSGMELGIRYDFQGLQGEVVPVHFYKDKFAHEYCSLYNWYETKAQTGGWEAQSDPLAAIRLNIYLNQVIAGTCPVRAVGHPRYGKNTVPIMKYVGLSIASPNTFLNDDLLFKEVIKNAPLSISLGVPNVSTYIEIGIQEDYHKGQLYVINEYLKLAQEKYKAVLNKSDPIQCNYFLNFFIAMGIVQSNEKKKYAEVFELNLESSTTTPGTAVSNTLESEAELV